MELTQGSDAAAETEGVCRASRTSARSCGFGAYSSGEAFGEGESLFLRPEEATLLPWQPMAALSKVRSPRPHLDFASKRTSYQTLESLLDALLNQSSLSADSSCQEEPPEGFEETRCPSCNRTNALLYPSLQRRKSVEHKKKLKSLANAARIRRTASAAVPRIASSLHAQEVPFPFRNFSNANASVFTELARAGGGGAREGTSARSQRTAYGDRPTGLAISDGPEDPILWFIRLGVFLSVLHSTWAVLLLKMRGRSWAGQGRAGNEVRLLPPTGPPSEAQRRPFSGNTKRQAAL